MDELLYTPLNLFNNYREAALAYPEVKIIHDEVLPAFPELGYQSTYSSSYQTILTRAYQLAQLGVSAGDKIILYKSAKFDTYLLAVAASYLGAVPVMASYHLPAATIDVFVSRLEDPFILFDEVTAKQVAALTKSSKEKQLSVALLLAQTANPVDQQERTKDEISYMTHTSGTTGIPKLICHSANSMGWRTKWQKTVFTKISHRKLVAFHISPVHSRFNIGVSSLMAMGFPMMPLSNGQSDHVAELLAKHQPIAFETHPNNFVQWAFTARKQPESFASIKYYHSTFDAINNQTMASFLHASKKQQPTFLQVYGQSECGPMILKAHTEKSLETNDARDMGIGLGDLTQARIANEKGQPLPPNTDGHIHFLSKGRALTYYQEDARFQENVYGDWWDSGDYGSMNEEGHLFLKDRQVDLIEAINSTLAIEDFLLDSLPFLAEVVIVRDPQGAPQPIIALAPDQEMNWEAWWKQIHELPHLNEPIIRPFDEIPRTATMKVQRLKIEQELKLEQESN